MTRFTKDKVLLLHKYLTDMTGGSHGVRDENLLDSALESVYATFDGVELYPTKEEKGARLCFNLINNHAFIDGNKRIGMYVMLTFLRAEGLEIVCTDDELNATGWAVAAGKMGYTQLLEWVKRHVK